MSTMCKMSIIVAMFIKTVAKGWRVLQISIVHFIGEFYVNQYLSDSELCYCSLPRCEHVQSFSYFHGIIYFGVFRCCLFLFSRSKRFFITELERRRRASSTSFLFPAWCRFRLRGGESDLVGVVALDGDVHRDDSESGIMSLLGTLETKIRTLNTNHFSTPHQSNLSSTSDPLKSVSGGVS